jgi:hypothetical protein
MKKIIHMSALLVFLFAISGCNIFEDADKPSNSDSEVFYYNAQSAINSGDMSQLEELELLIEDRIISNPEESESLNLMLSDVRLALSGVDLLDTATKLFDMVNSSDDPEVIATNITSIISMTPEQLAKLKLAIDGYADLPTDVNPALLSSEKRNVYMTAGIANTIYSANLILNVFDVNGDGSVNALDSTDLFGSSAVPSLKSKKFTRGYNGTIPTYEEFNAFWNEQKPFILYHLGNAALYLNIALNKYGVDTNTDNSKLISTIEDIKLDLNAYDNITEEDFNNIINMILTGKKTNN